ncbi:MAG: AAA family ATPase, partial [Muribaculaceae bacterium]|nr:AAA family ATPase [Muribaculaceae bacterium]
MERKNKKEGTKKDKTSRPEAQLPEIDLTNPEFNTALDLLTKTNSSVFLTGKAGTGKSTFLRYIAGVTKKRHVILAPTGIAAVNVGGQTIHSFFKIPLKPLLPDDPEFAIYKLRKRLKYNNQHIKLLKSLDLIIIDEISMVRADIIDFIDKILRVYTGNMRQPFGGKQLLFVGDIFQLEPVVTGNDRDVLSMNYSSFYFFNANVFKDIDLVPIELNKVYRQNEFRFIEVLNNIRMGKPTPEDIRLLNTRIESQTNLEASQSDTEKDFTMTIATRRDLVDEINTSHLRKLKTPEVTFEGSLIDDFPANALPTDLNLKLKAGAQVVFIKNDPDKRWVNGTLAVVEVCMPDNLTVRTEDGTIHKLEPEIWNHVKYT